MKSTVDTQFLNMLHSYQQHRAAIYITVCVMWDKGTSLYISYCQLQQVTQPHCNMLHSYQQNTAAIYITVCVMWHKGTSVYISYSQSHSHTSNQTIISYSLSVVSGHRTTRLSFQWQPIYRGEFIRTTLPTDWHDDWLFVKMNKWLTIWVHEWLSNWLNDWLIN